MRSHKMIFSCAYRPCLAVCDGYDRCVIAVQEKAIVSCCRTLCLWQTQAFEGPKSGVASMKMRDDTPSFPSFKDALFVDDDL
jgi:hypothetical protein